MEIEGIQISQMEGKNPSRAAVDIACTLVDVLIS